MISKIVGTFKAAPRALQAVEAWHSLACCGSMVMQKTKEAQSEKHGAAPGRATEIMSVYGGRTPPARVVDISRSSEQKPQNKVGQNLSMKWSHCLRRDKKRFCGVASGTCILATKRLPWGKFWIWLCNYHRMDTVKPALPNQQHPVFR